MMLDMCAGEWKRRASTRCKHSSTAVAPNPLSAPALRSGFRVPGSGFRVSGSRVWGCAIGQLGVEVFGFALQHWAANAAHSINPMLGAQALGSQCLACLAALGSRAPAPMVASRWPGPKGPRNGTTVGLGNVDCCRVRGSGFPVSGFGFRDSGFWVCWLWSKSMSRVCLVELNVSHSQVFLVFYQLKSFFPPTPLSLLIPSANDAAPNP